MYAFDFLLLFFCLTVTGQYQRFLLQSTLKIVTSRRRVIMHSNLCELYMPFTVCMYMHKTYKNGTNTNGTILLWTLECGLEKCVWSERASRNDIWTNKPYVCAWHDQNITRNQFKNIESHSFSPIFSW